MEKCKINVYYVDDVEAEVEAEYYNGMEEYIRKSFDAGFSISFKDGDDIAVFNTKIIKDIAITKMQKSLLERLHEVVILPDNYYLGVQEDKNIVILYKSASNSPDGFGYAIKEFKLEQTDHASLCQLALSLYQYLNS